MLVVDKPAGMVVHPAPGNWTGTLVNALKGRGGELAGRGGEDRAGIVHRLDKETSGLLLVAKTRPRAPQARARRSRRRRDRRGGTPRCRGATSTGDRSRWTSRSRAIRETESAWQSSVPGRAARTDFVRLARFDSGGPAARAPAHRTHAPDPRAPRVGGTPGGGR